MMADLEYSDHFLWIRLHCLPGLLPRNQRSLEPTFCRRKDNSSSVKRIGNGLVSLVLRGVLIALLEESVARKARVHVFMAAVRSSLQIRSA